MMKLFLLLGIFCLSITLSVSHTHIPDDDDSSEEHGSQDYDHHGKCDGLDDVDLSDLSLDSADLRKLISKGANENEFKKMSSVEGEGTSLEDVQSSVVENGMGVIRKVVVLPTKKRIYAKILKTSKAEGQFSTAFSGSINASLDAVTGGKVTFGVDVSVFGLSVTRQNTLTGQASLDSNSSTKWVKKGKVNILETTSVADSATTISWNDDDASSQGVGNMTAHSFSTTNLGTVILSKKCFVSKVQTSFNSSASGQDWSSSITGKGRGGVYSRVLLSTANGTSVTWTFAKLTIKTNLGMRGGNWSADGTQYITVKSYTETITRPINPSAANANLNLEVSNEIKIRVGAKTTLSNGIKIYSTGGQILFRTSKINMPLSGGNDNDGSEELVEGEDAEAAMLMAGTLLRKQVQADEVLVNPAFVNSVIASAIN